MAIVSPPSKIDWLTVICPMASLRAAVRLLRVSVVAPVEGLMLLNALSVVSSTRPAEPWMVIVGRQPASAAGTFSSVARSVARCSCKVGLLE